MINKYEKCTNKYGICLNVLLHYGKYRKIVGDKVRIKEIADYPLLVGEIGYVYDFEYCNFEKPIIVHFPKTKKQYCFAVNELERL